MTESINQSKYQITGYIRKGINILRYVIVPSPNGSLVSHTLCHTVSVVRYLSISRVQSMAFLPCSTYTEYHRRFGLATTKTRWNIDTLDWLQQKHDGTSTLWTGYNKNTMEHRHFGLATTKTRWNRATGAAVLSSISSRNTNIFVHIPDQPLRLLSTFRFHEKKKKQQ